MDRQELFQAVRQIIQANAPDKDRPFPASRIGIFLRQSLGGPAWEKYGFRSLKDLLLAMEQSGLIVVGTTDHGALAIQLNEAPQLPLEPTVPVAQKPTAYRPLRKAFWLAFAAEQPKGRRFFNRFSEEIRLALLEPPSGDWVEIEPVSADTQKSWAREFLASVQLAGDPDLVTALDEAQWYRALPNALQAKSPTLAAEWNRKRSSRIAQLVTAWCKSVSVDPETAFQRANNRRSTGVKTATTAPRQPWDENSMREIVLAAMMAAPTDLLVNLPIPPKYIFQILGEKSGH